MTRSERIFRAFLRAYPRSTRAASADDMTQLFSDRLRDAQGVPAKASVWVESVADIGVTATRQRLTRARPRVAEGPAIDGERSGWTDLGVAALPLVIAATVSVVQPGFLAPIFDSRVSLAGLPAGVGL